MIKPKWAIIFVILAAAAAAFAIGNVFGMELPWFLYIVISGFGFFLHTVILIIASDGEQEAQETNIKGRAK